MQEQAEENLITRPEFRNVVRTESHSLRNQSLKMSGSFKILTSSTQYGNRYHADSFANLVDFTTILF